MPDKTYMPKPLTHAQCARRSAIRADGKPTRADAALLDISLDGVRTPRLTRKDGRLRVVASVDGHGIRPERRYERVPVTRLRAKDLDAQLLSREIHGYRPSGVATTFTPKLSKATHQLRSRKGKGLDRGGSIFGNDDRYLFDDHSFPWRPPARSAPWANGDRATCRTKV